MLVCDFKLEISPIKCVICSSIMLTLVKRAKMYERTRIYIHIDTKLLVCWLSYTQCGLQTHVRYVIVVNIRMQV